MTTPISKFMSDFLLAASDYERLDETVHDFIDNGSPARIDEFSHRISETLVNAKKSITSAVASGSDVTLTDELPENIRDDVRYAMKMSTHWMERVKLLESMLRALVMEADADYIELMVRARDNLARMGIQNDPYTDTDVEDDSEDYPYEDEEEPYIEEEGSEEDDPEPEEGSEDDEPEEEGSLEPFSDDGPDFIHVGELPSEPRIVNGLEDDTIVPVSEEAPEDVPEEVPETVVADHEDLSDEEPVERIASTTDGTEVSAPADNNATADSKPLTKEDVAGIVLDVITDLFKPEPSAQPQRIELDTPAEEVTEQEEPKPAAKKPSSRKSSTSKKSTAPKKPSSRKGSKKSPVDKVLEILKKDDEEDSQ